MDIILKYFPQLSPLQIDYFTKLDLLYRDWNSKVNVISRKDIENLYLHHVLHSLSISKVLRFVENSQVLDLGTGGGFPGIPLSILFPHVRFLLVDGTLKKVKVVQEISSALGLKNVQTKQIRAEEIKGTKFDFVVTRAVAELPQLMLWCQKLFSPTQKNALPNGLLALKGGDILEEINSLPKGEYTEVFPIKDFFTEPYFEEKFVVYVQS
jgi:16S rRNA (guanine527-N7)-methyltransferase